MGAFDQDWKRWGPGKALYSLLMRRLQRHGGVHLFAINSRSLDPMAPVDSLPDGHSIRYLQAEDLEAAYGRPELGITRAMAEDAVARGDLCIGYFDAGRLVSYFWCGFAPTPMEGGWWVRFADGYSYAYKALTLPSHRGRHLQHLLTHANDRGLTRRGRHHNIEYIATHNFAQRAASARYGNRTVGYAGFVRCLGIQASFRTPGAKRAGFRMFRQAP